MDETLLSLLLRQLRTNEAEAAWGHFLDEYGSLISYVIKYFESDPDDAADCFQFVCEQLVKDRFHRLQKFKPDGPASFATWLRAVVRNLCLDWRRKQHGRLRQFQSVERLSLLDREVFRCVYERGASEQETLENLIGRFRELTADRISDAVERINQTLTARQRATLGNRVNLKSQSSKTEDNTQPAIDQSANPETLAIEKQKLKRLRRALGLLGKEKRLLLKLRFEEALTLEEIARLLQLGNAQRADREIKQALLLLRNEMSSSGAIDSAGKDPHLSVKVEWKKSI